MLFWILSKVPKWRPFKWFLSRGNKKKSQELRSGKQKGWETAGMLFFCQKLIDGDCCVTWGVVVVQHPIACNAWLHMCHPFPEFFKDFPIKSLIDSLSWWHKFLVDDPLTVKKTNEHRFDFGFAHSRFLGTQRVCSVPLLTSAFWLGVVLQNPWFVTCDNVTEEFWLLLQVVQKIKTHLSDWPSPQSRGSMEPSWHTLFSCPNPVLKFDGR